MVNINKLYTIFTNGFSCIKTNSILFTVPMFFTGSNPTVLQYFGMGISSVSYLQKMYTHEYKHITWNSTQKVDLFVFQRVRLYNTFPFICQGIPFLAMRRCPSFFYPKWHKNDYQNEPCYTGVVYTELCNFSPKFIHLFSAQNTKVKKAFILITKITGFSLPSVSAVSFNQCPLGSEDAGGFMCSPAAGLESVWRSGPLYRCHSMTHGKWIHNQECLYPPRSLSNPPCFMAAVTGSASALLARPAFKQFMIWSDGWHQACAEWREGRERWRSRKEPAEPWACS